MTDQAVLLLVLLMFCHFLADYTPMLDLNMIKAKEKGSPIGPIIEHGITHGVLMLWVVLIMKNIPLSCLTFVIQSTSHALIDILKGKIGVWFPVFKDYNKRPLWALMGFDQYLHFIVILWIVYLVTKT